MSVPGFELILGSMRSGKTAELISLFDRFNEAGWKIVVVNPTQNIRVVGPVIKSTLNGERPAVRVERLSELASVVDLGDVDAIFIDELFMLGDAPGTDPDDTFQTILGWLGDGKRVVAASLEVLGNGHMSPTVKRVLELVPDVHRVFAACKVRRSPRCTSEEARFTVICDLEGNPIPFEELDAYTPEESGERGSTHGFLPACRACFFFHPHSS